uniref:Uncharacterized protein n=1 Tax=Kalanchoe fedtschenkoi TaxID=63787 RepID=A0A7N0UXK2_KALFE
MSVVGFDFGNETCVVAVARQRAIDVVLNDESKRETPAVICFGEKQRFIGTAGAASTMSNPKNAISQIKRLIGRQFSDPELQKDLAGFPFSVTEGPDGYPLINVQFLGETRSFTPTQLLGMLFSNLKGIAEKNLNAAVVDCCIGIPVYFTDLQRRAIVDAATIAGLHPLHLIHETTATALAYGIYKTELPETEPLNVAFVDIGHASMQVCIAAYKKGQLKILSHAFDRSLGGRDFDEVEAPKKKVKRTNIPVVELVYGGIPSSDLQMAVEKEFEMALQDRVMEETKDKKNAVEAYVYDMRNKLYDKYQEFVTESEKDVLIAKLQDVEDWLYEDGEDETKSVYVAKLEELKKASLSRLHDLLLVTCYWLSQLKCYV